MNPPFYYRLIFSVFAYNNSDDLRLEQFTKDYIDKNPIKARYMAFSDFTEYLTWLKELGRIQKTRDNYLLVRPEKINQTIHKAETKHKISETDAQIPVSLLGELIELYEKYDDEIRIDIVLSEEAMRAVNEVDPQLTIHKVASREYDPDDLLCGGLLVETQLYNYYNLDTGNQVIEVEYYGTDYYEAGDDPGAGHYVILKTPREWISEERKEEEKKVTNINPSINDLEDIIQKGEGKHIEFKPSLVYNFKTHKGGISVKYHTAKTIAAFLNSKGGILFIGINNKGEIVGIEKDYSLFREEENPKDKLKLEFDDLLKHFFPPFVSDYIKTDIKEIQGKDIYVVRVWSSKHPVVLKQYNADNDDNKKGGNHITGEFYYRQEASSRKIMDLQEILNYVKNHDPFNENSNL